MNIEDLKKSKLEEVKIAIEQINKEHKTGDPYWGDLSADEAKERYTEILVNLKEMPGLSEEDIQSLTVYIQDMIEKIPQVESEKAKELEEYEEYESEKKEAFEKAKERYSGQSTFKKVKDVLRGKTPKSYEVENMSKGEIDNLYR